jgi:phytol kinase
MLALMLMCGGDGLADLVGRRWGRVRLPVNPDKSWAGSAAMLVGSFTFAFGYLALFNAFGNFQPQLDLARAAWATAAISLAATAVEALPLPHVDNLTTTATAIALGLLLF